jgi:predicted Zn finger-like uncharacterized protein
MDVICQRCQTRYEFDDALVSARGTTVKCTQCGHLFRVHAAAGKDARDSWTVRTTDGAELTYRAMRELQAAITSGTVSRDDTLIGSGSARLLGDIEELESFFPAGASLDPDTVRRPRRHGSTRIGVNAPTPRGSEPQPSPSQTDREGNPLPARSGSTLRPAASRVTEESAPFEVVKGQLRAAHRVPSTPPSSPSEPGQERPTIPEPKASESTSEAVAAMAEAVSAALAEDEPTDPGPGRPTVPSDDETYDDDPRDLPMSARVSEMPDTLSYPPSDRSSTSSAPMTPSPSVARPSILGRASAFTDPRFSSFESTGKQPSFARWLIGLVLLGVVAVVGFTLLKRYLPSGQSATSAPHTDARVDKFLREGNARLAAGDLEGAREQLIMATGVTETDPRVARALTLVEIVRADIPWLHLKLLGDDADERDRVQKELAQAVDRAARVAERAQTLDPQAADGVRLRIDVLRLRGDHAAARNLVGQLKDPGPRDAVALAALDLSEPEPSWSSVLDRLRTATREERKLGRARSMLVYALARSGRGSEAARELDAFAAASPRHPLLDRLRAYVESAPASEPADETDAGADGEVASSDTGDDIPADFRDAIRKAQKARAAGNLDRAAELYQAALDKSPGNSEALSGLADVHRARGNTSQAMRMYQKLLDQNPGYLPALVGLADLKWQSGSRSEAESLYRQVIDAAPGSAYAEHAQSRIGSSKSTPSPATPPPTTATSEPSEPPPAATPTATADAPPADSPDDLPPGVDVSDLPEFH